jgi:hypothetical protein
LFEELDDYAIEWCVFEASLESFCERSAYCEGNNNVVGVLGCAVVYVSVSRAQMLLMDGKRRAYIADTPLLEGVICETIAFSLSAIVNDMI